MLIIITNEHPNVVNSLSYVCKSLKSLKIPYEVVGECDPAIIKRKDIRAMLFPGRSSRIHPYDIQPRLELELFYLYHFPNLPTLGICHGCQLLMLYHGGGLVHHDTYWIRSPEIELDLAHCGNLIFHGEEPRQKLYVHFHDLPVVTPAAKKAGVREIAWMSQFRDGRRHACAFEFVKNRVYGFMFHPEAKKETRAILSNFYYKVAAGAAAT